MKPSFRNTRPADVSREGTLVCVACRREEPVPPSDLDRALARLAEAAESRTLYVVVAVFGFCRFCRKDRA